MQPARFTKDDLRQELKGAVLQFIRQSYAVLDMGAPYRLLGWTEREPADNPIHDIECWDLDEVARREGQALDVERFQIFSTFDDFYDYGVSGIRRSDVGDMTCGTEFSFAYAFVFDLSRSELVSDLNNGERPGCRICLETARLAQARALLDGGERYFHEDNEPADLLTFRDVALLANMEERSVRNAAAGKAATLRTTTRDGATHIAPADAREWLKERKGFVPSRARGHFDFDLNVRSFQGAWELGEFVRERAHHRSVTLADLCRAMGCEPPSDDATGTNSDSWMPQTAEHARSIAALIGVEPRPFELRVRELHLFLASRDLRKELEALRATAAR